MKATTRNVFAYLDAYKETGQMDLFAALVNIQKNFGLSDREAEKLLWSWKESFGDESKRAELMAVDDEQRSSYDRELESTSNRDEIGWLKDDDDEPEFLVRDNRLKPPKRYRYVRTRTCAYCRFLMKRNLESWCVRPGGPQFSDDEDAVAPYQFTCERWQSAQSKGTFGDE